MAGHNLHALIGLLVAIIVIYLVDVSAFHTLVLILLSIVYAVLPDIDISSSVISKFIFIIGLLLILACILYVQYILAILCVLILLILRLLKHRGITHTIRAGIFLALPVFLFSWQAGLVALLAYFSHLVLDFHIKW